jgi:hypothetical protein
LEALVPKLELISQEIEKMIVAKVNEIVRHLELTDTDRQSMVEISGPLVSGISDTGLGFSLHRIPIEAVKELR